MPLVLTSDFPSTPNEAVFGSMRARGKRPRIAWIPPYTDTGRERFIRAKEQFAAHGFTKIEYCDIDEVSDQALLRQLVGYDVLYLTGGDPLRFRRNIARVDLGERLRECLGAGCLVIGASGGALQLTPNVSLYRLVDASVAPVLAKRAEYEALAFVDYELLPHLNRLTPEFLAKVRAYSASIGNDVIALADGAAVLHDAVGDFTCVGTVSRIRSGEMTLMDAT